MKLKFAYPGVVKDGRVDLSDRTKAQYLANLKQFKDGDIVEVTLQKKRTKHSDALRGYYFGVIVRLGAETTGYTEDEFHALAKALHLDKQTAAEGENGRLLGEYVIGGSIADLSNGPMSEFVGRVREWMHGALDCPTPEPNPNWKDEAA